LWSISRERVPDLLLTLIKGSEHYFLLLDAKYRASRSAILEAMESAHIYRDSLRFGQKRAEAVLLIVPNDAEAGWLTGVEFQKEHGVGVFQLRPGFTPTLPAALTELLNIAED
jgi:hypothetical protein